MISHGSTCTQCNFFSNVKSDFEEHMKGHLKCTICEKLFENVRELDEHKTLCSSQLYQCGECGKCFTSIDTLYRHLYTLHDNHTGTSANIQGTKQPELLKCSKCPYECGNFSSLSNHKRDYHQVPKCFQCDMVFTTNENLLKHMELSLIHI